MRIYGLMVLLLLFTTGCQRPPAFGHEDRVGLLLETTIHDEAWGQQGYLGLQSIKDSFGMDVYFKEGVQSYQDTIEAVDELVDQGVNIIFGHSQMYGSHFKQLHEDYGDVQFIYFNGAFTAENVTSLNFSADAMGFFAGMVAGEMTESNRIGLIAAFEWQPEVEGFYAGATYYNPQAEIDIKYTYDWENEETAEFLYEKMQKDGADVFYPAGDGFNIPIIEKAQEDELYAIGYVQDQSGIAENTVLTSTVQRVDRVYVMAMDRYLENGLPNEPITFGFKEGAIEIGSFSPAVPEKVQLQIEEAVDQYIENGQFPYTR
ncbi:BMP family ABC transporter substrate-binding protein [Halobacillus sp. B23F22_1]|uniref:BMP family ABC transporter substrate-binding protein n=1 Tax=Halobacillus sp. B23F22_1 TaxID=3459514 RepID=UPI00373F08F2